MASKVYNYFEFGNDVKFNCLVTFFIHTYSYGFVIAKTLPFKIGLRLFF